MIRTEEKKKKNGKELGFVRGEIENDSERILDVLTKKIISF